MNRKWVPYLLIAGLAIALFFVRRWNEMPGNRAGKTATTTAPGNDRKGGADSKVSRGAGKTAGGDIKNAGRDSKSPGSATASPEINRNRGFDRRTSFLEYTRHARCRMECRQITQAEVEAIMEEGTINYAKSDVKARPCPEYAIEGNTADGQRVRMVFAQCDQKTKVVTVIDLGRDWSCSCEGDNKKNRN